MQENLFGEVQCSKGWGYRCPHAHSKVCTCACGGKNHGTAVPQTVKLSKQKKPRADISVFIVEDPTLEKELLQKYFGKGITFVQLFKQDEREKITKALEQIA